MSSQSTIARNDLVDFLGLTNQIGIASGVPHSAGIMEEIVGGGDDEDDIPPLANVAGAARRRRRVPRHYKKYKKYAVAHAGGNKYTYREWLARYDALSGYTWP